MNRGLIERLLIIVAGESSVDVCVGKMMRAFVEGFVEGFCDLRRTRIHVSPFTLIEGRCHTYQSQTPPQLSFPVCLWKVAYECRYKLIAAPPSFMFGPTGFNGWAGPTCENTPVSYHTVVSRDLFFFMWGHGLCMYAVVFIAFLMRHRCPRHRSEQILRRERHGQRADMGWNELLR